MPARDLCDSQAWLQHSRPVAFHLGSDDEAETVGCARIAWKAVARRSLLLFHGCRSAVGANRRAAGAWSSSGASACRVSSATLACVHESRSVPRVREMTAGAAELHGEQQRKDAEPTPVHHSPKALWQSALVGRAAS